VSPTLRGSIAVNPILRWAGGKRRLLPTIRQALPTKFDLHTHHYFEPFFGAGAVGLDILANYPQELASHFRINDINSDLINLYRVLASPSTRTKFIAEFDKMRSALEVLDECGTHCRVAKRGDDSACPRNAYFKVVRSSAPTSNYQKAARFLFLNRTCFNGLYRVNAAGMFNVPFGHLKKVRFPDREELITFGRMLNSMQITNMDFVEATSSAGKGDFVYFDPPYIAATETANFTSYDKSGFGLDEQKRLADCIRDLMRRGCFVMLSNSDTEQTDEIFGSIKEFHLSTVSVHRSISAGAASRQVVTERLGISYRLPAGVLES